MNTFSVCDDCLPLLFNGYDPGIDPIDLPSCEASIDAMGRVCSTTEIRHGYSTCFVCDAVVIDAHIVESSPATATSPARKVE